MTRLNTKEGGYAVIPPPVPSKRYCLTLDLSPDPERTREYLRIHSEEGFWRVIGDGIRRAGILVMDIYHVDHRLFMICEAPLETDFDQAWSDMGRYERQEEWGELTRRLQQALPGHPLEWVKMERVFRLYESTDLPSFDHSAR